MYQFFSVPLNVLSRDADTLPLAIKPVERLEVINTVLHLSARRVSWITVAIKLLNRQAANARGRPSNHHSVGAGGTQYL